MKKLLVWGLASLCFLPVAAENRNLTVTVANNWNKAKTDEPVIVNLSDIEKRHNLKMDIRSATVWDGEQEIPSQLDDLNRNGEADELAFVIDIPAKSTKTLKIVFSSEPGTHTYPARVYAHMKLSDKNKKTPEINYLTIPGTTPDAAIYSSIYGHGPCFESEYTAYRLYFDNRQSIDIYGKQKRQLELAETNFYTTEEQMQQGFGSDVLWAGKTVSLGSFRGWENGAPSYVNKVASRSEGVLARGPIRSIIEIEDQNWEYNGKKLNMTQRYILYAGHRDVEINVSFKEKAAQNDVFCTGVMKLESNRDGFIHQEGLAGSWGDNVPEKGKPQIVETVGLGVYVQSQNLQSINEDEGNYLMLIKPDEINNSIKYWITFCAAKEEKGFTDAKLWFSNLADWQKNLQNPCKVTVTYHPNKK